MTRLAAQEKGEYYPTPPEVVEIISRAIRVQLDRDKPTLRIFDPCVGEGLAVAQLASALKERLSVPIQTWGVEINPRRAAEAATRVDMVVEAPFECAYWKPSRSGVASILFLNPPYDFSEHSQYTRIEHFFIEKATDALVTGGLLIYIIPVTAIDWWLVQYLWEWYEGIQVFRFPDGLYEQFKQVVIFGNRRKMKAPYAYPDRDSILAGLASYWRREETIPLLPQLTDLQPFSLVAPTARENATLFRASWTEAEIAAFVEKDGVSRPLAMALDSLYGPEEQVEIRPLVPPKRGHLAQMLASGLMGTMRFPGEILKGQSVKTKRLIEEHVEVTEDGEEVEQKFKEVYETHIVRVTLDGVEHLDTPDKVKAFLEANADRLARLLKERLRPYGNSVKPEEEAVLDGLCRNRRPLPGQREPGLLPDQRTTAIALTRSILRHGVGHAVCEMGYGKTTVSLAVAELLHLRGRGYPVLVVTPPHLVEKWAREAEEVIGPEVRAVVVESISELEAIRRSYRPGDRLVVIISRSRIKLGSGWGPAVAYRYTLPDKKDGKEARARFRKAVAAYEEARRKYLAARDRMTEAEREEAQARLADLRRKALEKATAVAICPECGAPAVDGHIVKDPSTLRKRPHKCATGRILRSSDAEDDLAYRSCGAPLYQFVPEVRRWPLADYIRKKMRGFFRLLVADEVHQYKAKESDQGWAFGVLANAIPQTLTLTGTFFGGPSTSIFWLLHRTQGDVRQAFGFDEEHRWVETFGVLEETVRTSKNGGGDSAYYLARQRQRVSVRERPGISPGIVRYILQTSIFRSISDLGLALPPFRDEVVRIEMSEQQAADYLALYATTWQWLLEYWPRYTAAWLQWVLARPNSAFRTEVATNPDGKQFVMPPVVADGELLPKEEWLVATIKSELAQGRRCLVYVRQTGTRDIRDRLVDILTQAGIAGVKVLSETIDPRKREEWLKKNEPSVLITNPRLVETGLDLIQYSTGIFYEPDYSLYTLWQACRRIWRLGQTQPVKVYYAVYTSPDSHRPAMEDLALRLIGQKMAAAQLLYGDDVAGALVPDMDDDLLMQIVNVLKSGEAVSSVNSLFGQDDRTTQSPLGSPTRLSTVLVPLEEWIAQHGGMAAVARPTRRKRAVIGPGQLALF